MASENIAGSFENLVGAVLYIMFQALEGVIVALP